MKGKYIISGVEGIKDNTIIDCTIDNETKKRMISIVMEKIKNSKNK